MKTFASESFISKLWTSVFPTSGLPAPGVVALMPCTSRLHASGAGTPAYPLLCALPACVCGLWLAIHDARTHTVLPAHVAAGLVTQVLWCLAARTPWQRVWEALGISIAVAIFVWTISMLPGRPIGDGDALTTALFVFALVDTCPPHRHAASAGLTAATTLAARPILPVIQVADVLTRWLFFTAFCALMLLMMRTIARTARGRLCLIRGYGLNRHLLSDSRDSGPPAIAFIPAQYAGFILMLLSAST
jgi:hypothetical protein